MNLKDFRAGMEKAKKLKPVDRATYVPLEEFGEGAGAYLYPMMDSERAELVELMTEVGEWAIILLCLKDENGERVFNVDDIEFLGTLGYDFQQRLWQPAFELSGLGKDYSVANIKPK